MRLLRTSARRDHATSTAEPETVDVRIITATNKDLPSMIASGEFREDLYYRVAMGILNTSTAGPWGRLAASNG